MRADLVTDAIQTMTFEVHSGIWHSEEAQSIRSGSDSSAALTKRRMSLSMSRAGTPTDNGYAERFVGVFKLAVADRHPYHTLGEFLRAAEARINLYSQERPHEGLDNLSPLQYVQQHGLEDIPSLALL